MKYRVAKKEDLPALELMFKDIVECMNKNGIAIWNEFYPYEEFADGIDNQNLYLIEEKEEIVAAFGINGVEKVIDCFEWKDSNAKAVYLTYVGVNVKLLRQGIGEQVIKYATKIARQQNAEFLRLLVVDINKPAINLYKKNGFNQVVGEYKELSESLNKNLLELGFEIDLF